MECPKCKELIDDNVTVHEKRGVKTSDLEREVIEILVKAVRESKTALSSD